MKRAMAAAIVAAQGVAFGAEAKDTTINRHEGFFLRLDAEPGYLSTSVSGATLTGTGVGMGIGIGGAVAENFILFLHVYSLGTSNPTVPSGSTSPGTGVSEVFTVGYGLGLSYYFMPENIYVSATLAITHFSVAGSQADSNGTNPNIEIGNSYAGPGGRIAIGKEWWVSDHWGLGVAGQLSFAFNKDNGAADAPTWTTFAPSVAFSATFN